MSTASVTHRHASRVERDNLGASLRKIAGLSARDIAVRFAFGAAVSAVAGIVAALAGVRVGGVLLAFPAILPAALTLIEQREGTSQAIADTRGAVVGALGLVGFAGVVIGAGDRLPLYLTLLLATAAWALIGFGLYAAGIALGKVLGAEQYLPDVSVSETRHFAEMVRERGLTLAVAESCTGGALASLLAAVPRASSFFRGGIVAYDDDVKRSLLHVPDATLDVHGAVSEETVIAMARGVRDELDTDIGLAITGVVGGETEGKPQGVVFVAISDRRHDRAVRVESGGGPERIRADAIRAALHLCRDLG